MARQMRRFFDSDLIERLLFSAVVLGVLLAVGGALRYVMLANQLTGNPAARAHEAGGEVEIESKSQAQGLMAADIERRRLVAEQFNMMIVGGGGLALLGLGWLGMDLRRGKRRASANREASAGTR